LLLLINESYQTIIVLTSECAANTIGVENKYIIPDSSFKATSSHAKKWSPSNGRLNATFGWLAKTNTNPNDYLQLDLGLPYVVCAIATQGSSDEEEWVTIYKIKTSLDNSNWTTYQEHGIDKVFCC
jgi:hypothetical protein